MSNVAKNFFKPADDVRPNLNVGGLFDLACGNYVKGTHGNSIVNGGMARSTGVAARGNMFKTTLMDFFAGRALARYAGAQVIEYDNEDSGAVDRKLSLYYSHTQDETYEERFESGEYIYTDLTKYRGDEFFEQLKLLAEDRVKEKAKLTKTTPFFNETETGELESITSMPPVISAIDSISMMTFGSTEKLQKDNKIGESGLNMEAARSAMAKTQMLNQLPSLLARGQMYILMTAHAGDKVDFDMFPTDKKKLAFMNNIVFKYCPERFTFLMNNLWLGFKSEMLANASTKAPEYPRNAMENTMAGSTDLQIINYKQLRGKGGTSGMWIELVVSQEEGVLIDLTSFHYLRSKHKYWGLSGSQQYMELPLYPGKKYQRTTIREELKTDYKLQTAVHITAQLCQLYHDKLSYPRDMLVMPEEMRSIIERRGYDWDQLLECRFYWVYLEDEKDNPRKELSTEDLLLMCKGTYVPYWMDEKDVPKHARTPLDELPKA